MVSVLCFCCCSDAFVFIVMMFLLAFTYLLTYLKALGIILILFITFLSITYSSKYAVVFFYCYASSLCFRLYLLSYLEAYVFESPYHHLIHELASVLGTFIFSCFRFDSFASSMPASIHSVFRCFYTAPLTSPLFTHVLRGFYSALY